MVALRPTLKVHGRVCYAQGVDLRVRGATKELLQKLGAWAQLLGVKRDDLVLKLLQEAVDRAGPQLRKPKE
jgi:hypothetical protein